MRAVRHRTVEPWNGKTIWNSGTSAPHHIYYKACSILSGSVKLWNHRTSVKWLELIETLYVFLIAERQCEAWYCQIRDLRPSCRALRWQNTQHSRPMFQFGIDERFWSRDCAACASDCVWLLRPRLEDLTQTPVHTSVFLQRFSRFDRCERVDW
jgi:hypothetical protein